MSSPLDRVGARLLRSRRVVRAPIWLYRHRLGWLLGRRVLMLRHTGRTSRAPRYVCLEVVDRPVPGTVVVASGFGVRAQWYRNLQALPECAVDIGFRRDVPATARLMSDQESRAAADAYRQKHPRAWERLCGAIEAAVGTPVTVLPMVALSMKR